MKNKLIILFVSLFLLQPLFSQTEDELKLMFRIAERGHGVDVYRLRNMIQKNPSYLGVTDDDWNNFLHIASIHSNTFVFDMLEELGISSESVNKYGESLVLVHINRTRLGINPAFFKWLLERYKDTDLINKPDNYGVPPIMALVDKGFLDWVPTLHEKYGAILDVRDNDNRTIAMAMVQKNDIKYMKYLRDHGVDMLAVDDLGHDVLWYAKKANTSFDLLMMIEGFLRSDNEEYAKKIISGETGFDIGNTTLAVNKLPELLGNIHKVDLDVSIQDAKIFVLLKKLVNDGDFELLKKAFIFIEDENSRLKDIKLSDIVYENGKTLMHFASEQGHTDVVEFLYNKDNTFIYKRDLDGKNPYERALNNDNVLTSAYIKDPRSFIREKMNGMNIEASKKDLPPENAATSNVIVFNQKEAGDEEKKVWY
jgi:ankyrin repeat protein